MKFYFNTAVLLKAYIEQVNSVIAELLLIAPFVIAYTHLHSIELSNAIRLKRFRKESTLAEEHAALRMLQADLVSGRLQRPAYDLSLLFRRGGVLSKKYAAVVGMRSMDVLHVAAALEIGCSQFVSFDKRQRKVAAKEGLKVLPKG